MLDRIKTGISGFDEIIEGGLPKNSVVLVSGSPGTGKTLFCLESLYRGCTSGNYGVLLSFEQSQEDILTQSGRFKWDLKRQIDSGRLVIKHVDILAEQNIFELIKDLVPQKEKSVTLVIDSLTALQNYPAMLRNADRLVGLISQKQPTTSISEDSIHRMLIHYFISALKNMKNTTSFLITDVPYQSSALSSDGISEFMCDGVIQFHSFEREDSMFTINVNKMRFTHHKRGIFSFEITEEGIKVSE